uniref:Uncharacterized protein n=1 Tax=Solanum tuberosum TaxID=4113 RepID=M1CV25_SOLTU
MLKEIHGWKRGRKFFIKMSGGCIQLFLILYAAESSCLLSCFNIAVFNALTKPLHIYNTAFSYCSNLARIERSAQKQAKSGTENAGWYENWSEKYDAKGWTEKGAHKYGRLNEQSWWEKWGEEYDGRGSVLKWTDKWAESELGTKWGDKWEEKFFAGIGSRQGETWHASLNSERWSRTWGEEHFGNGKVHKYGKSTTGESWDMVVDEKTYYEAEPHYGWADVVGDSSQLFSIQPREQPPGVYPNIDFGSSVPPDDESPPTR